MGETNDLQNFLREKAHAEDKENSVPDWDARKNKWFKNVSDLYELIREWLDPLEKEGTVNFLETEIKITEDYIGTYEIESLAILIGKQRVAFYPKGTLIVGAEGRVDIRGQKAARTIIVNNDQWYFIEKEPKIHVAPFDQDSFQRILGEVME